MVAVPRRTIAIGVAVLVVAALIPIVAVVIRAADKTSALPTVAIASATATVAPEVIEEVRCDDLTVDVVHVTRGFREWFPATYDELSANCPTNVTAKLVPFHAVQADWLLAGPADFDWYTPLDGDRSFPGYSEPSEFYIDPELRAPPVPSVKRVSSTDYIVTVDEWVHISYFRVDVTGQKLSGVKVVQKDAPPGEYPATLTRGCVKRYYKFVVVAADDGERWESRNVAVARRTCF